MARKPKITRTLGPIHFEDLDPHRFEDMVRQLIYDFRDWQTIEATGRSGSDEGFDARAYEKVSVQSSDVDDQSEGEYVASPMDGNLWMIQGKRERALGPKRVKDILNDVDTENPPYGYILAASADFSKESRDVFREQLRKKGVMEFYLWGKGELEDMLYQPKNDRILFTFFGMSLVSKRKSRTTEIRQVVINKNKLISFFGENPEGRSRVLLRDSNDTEYPYKDRYGDFEKDPRWREYEVTSMHALSLIVRTREQFAYVNTELKEYDRAEDSNRIYRDDLSDDERGKQRLQNEKVEDYWDHLPNKNKAKYFRNALVRYEEMLVIDPKGDSTYKCPHIFIDFEPSGPFSGGLEFLMSKEEQILLSDYKRIEMFPKKLPSPKIGKIHDTKGITLTIQAFNMLTRDIDRLKALYVCDDSYSYLKQRDLVPIENVNPGSSTKYYLQITNIETSTVGEYLDKNGDHLMWDIERQIGRQPAREELLTIYEFKKTYDFVIDRMRKDKKPKEAE